MILGLASCSGSDPSNKSVTEVPQALVSDSDPIESGISSIPMNCESAWKVYIESNPEGLSETRKITLDTESRADHFHSVSFHSVSFHSVSMMKTQILESSPDLLNVEVVMDDVTPLPVAAFETSAKSFLKGDFLNDCLLENPSGVSTAMMMLAPVQNKRLKNVKLLDKALKWIQVDAGHFNCDYRKIQGDQLSGGDTILETWTARKGDRYFEVKSVSVFRKKVHGAVQTVATRTSELSSRSL